MYHIYHTEGIILASTATGESDRFFQILTPDLGLIPVVARGSRALGSKLRYRLTEYAHIDIDVVRGKDVWTLTGVLPMDDTPIDPRAYGSMSDASMMLRRLIHGSVPSPEIYTDTRALRALVSARSIDDTEALLLAFRVRILAVLGYAPSDTDISTILQHPLADACTAISPSSRARIARIVSQALLETQL
jgi:DNA repair protein RecO